MNTPYHVKSEARILSSMHSALSFARDMRSHVTSLSLIVGLCVGIGFGMLSSYETPMLTWLNLSEHTASPTYPVSLDSTLLVRLKSSDALTHHAMIDVVMLASDPTSVSRLSDKKWVVQALLRDLLETTPFEALISIEGKKRLREEAKSRINAVFANNAITPERLMTNQYTQNQGQPETVAAVLFTNYLVQ